MAVSLTISETMGGAQVSDSLAGGGTGVDLGSVINDSYAPVTSKASNTGHQDLYISHDATIDPITDLKTFIQTYGVGTGATYGGADSAANDFTSLKSLGNASGSSKNNNDGNSGGFWLDMDADAATANQFDWATDGIGQGGQDTVLIFGDNNTDAIDLTSAQVIAAEAMVYDAPGETIATAPEDGKVGKSGDTALGEYAHLKTRIYLPSSHSDGGILQFETVFAFSFTA